MLLASCLLGIYIYKEKIFGRDLKLFELKTMCPLVTLGDRAEFVVAPRPR